MRLRRVSLLGFKTFARRTEVVFDEGITAIVGPNGSGKSNLVDAIRWALGETSARELRGLRMEEVIHAGGQGRPPMGLAEVEVVLDNEDGRLPVEDTEVAIGRRVTRGGESEFRLNGSRIRLRDLERLLAATGLTQSGYAVVAQNDIDAIIEATPRQRRALLEEAAGVRGLRAASDEARERVAATEARLLRLADALADAEPRLAELAEQAAVAEEHAALVARLTELRGSLTREEWRVAAVAARRASQRLEQAVSRAAAAASASADLTARLETARTELARYRAERREAEAAAEAARLDAEGARRDTVRFLDQARASGLQRAATVQEVVAAGEELTELEAQRADAEASGRKALAALEAAEAEVARSRERADTARAVLAEAEAALVGVRAEADAAERREGETVAALRDCRARLSLLEEAIGRLRADLETAHADLRRHLAAAEEAGRRSDAAQADLDARRQRHALARSAAEAARRQLAEARDREAEAHRLLREASARLAAIEGQIDGTVGSGAVADAVRSGRVRGRRILEGIRLRDPADAAAVEAALEEHLGAWVVEDLDAALDLLRVGAVREEVLGSGLPVIPVPAPPPGTRHVLDALAVDEDVAGALSRCLERTWLAGDMSIARSAVAVGGGTAILPDGTRVTAAGVRGGGRPGVTVSLAAAQADARAHLDQATADHAAASALVARAAEAATAADAAVAGAQEEAECAATSAAEAAAEAAAAARRAAADRERIAALESDLGARLREAERLRQEHGALESAVADARQVSHRFAEAVSGAERDVETLRRAWEAAEAALRAAELVAARAEPEARAVHRRLAALRQGSAAAEHRLRVAELRLLEAEEAAMVALRRTALEEERLAAADVALAQALERVEGIRGPLAEAEALLERLEADRAAVAVETARAEDDRNAAAEELERWEARAAELARALREELDEDIEEIDPRLVERTEREIVRLERRIASLGPVNALAPEQRRALAERVACLRRDHDDLAAACIDLRLIGEVLDREVERRFEAVFGAVAYHFRALFEELFGGGRATLRLVEPTEEDGDPGPAGVEILAQPAGKRLQVLSLLSGGERALTALAVILALQQVNPSPFYLFDEVDAALDDVNVGRFARLVRRLADRQQFVLVTHNHVTMASADCLYGVTMEGDGTSRVLSVRLVDGEVRPVAAEAGATVAVAG